MPNSVCLDAETFSAAEIETIMDPILFKQESSQTIIYNYFDPENVDKKLRSGKLEDYPIKIENSWYNTKI